MAVAFLNGYMEQHIPTLISRAVQDCMQIPENRKRFEEWYREKYGREYVWKVHRCTYNFETDELVIEEEVMPREEV